MLCRFCTACRTSSALGSNGTQKLMKNGVETAIDTWPPSIDPTWMLATATVGFDLLLTGTNVSANDLILCSFSFKRRPSNNHLAPSTTVGCPALKRTAPT